MLIHLRALQGVADSNGGNRASGLQGYGGTTQYLLTALRAAGYQPTVQTFTFPFFRQLEDSVFESTAPNPKAYAEGTSFFTMSYSGSGDTTALVRAVDINTAPGNRANTSGCEAADFVGFPAGQIALMQRGSCNFGVKVANAEDAGASGAIIFNQGDNPTPARSAVFAGTLGAPVGIPAVSVSFDDGVELSAAGTTVHIKTQTQNDDRTTSNVIAETPGGNAGEVVLVGSHLDSVPEGPGINDNGTGSAFNLELALQMAKLGITPTNKVRFAWWGAEEEGLLGSTYYVAQLSDAAFENIQLNLNFDMLGSPNHAKFVYDGDFSDTTPPATAPTVNPGAAEIERVFVEYFTSVGLQSEPSGFDGRSDYKAFQDNGVAAGGLFSGAEVSKTAAQAAKWGGLPNVAFDPNYHRPATPSTTSTPSARADGRRGRVRHRHLRQPDPQRGRRRSRREGPQRPSMRPATPGRAVGVPRLAAPAVSRRRTRAQRPGAPVLFQTADGRQQTTASRAWLRTPRLPSEVR